MDLHNKINQSIRKSASNKQFIDYPLNINSNTDNNHSNISPNNNNGDHLFKTTIQLQNTMETPIQNKPTKPPILTNSNIETLDAFTRNPYIDESKELADYRINHMMHTPANNKDKTMSELIGQRSTGKALTTQVTIKQQMTINIH